MSYVNDSRYEGAVTATNKTKLANKWPEVLGAAAVQFAAHGYYGTRIREIAAAAGMTAGAIYFHIPTKQKLLLAVYEEGVRRISDRLETVLKEETNPVARIKAAIRTHLEMILEENAYARVIVRVVPSEIPEIAPELKRLRERYEAKFRALLHDLPLPIDRDRKLARLILLGGLNWTPVWYHGTGTDLEPLVREFLASLNVPDAQGDRQ